MAEDAGEQVIGPERAVPEPEEIGASFLDRRRNAPAPVDRLVNQESSLPVRGSSTASCTRVTGPVAHAVPSSRARAIASRRTGSENMLRPMARMFAGFWGSRKVIAWNSGEGPKARVLERRNVRLDDGFDVCLFIVADETAEPDTLDPGVALLYLQPLDVSAELGPPHLRVLAAKSPGSPVKHREVGVEAADDRRADAVCLVAEVRLLLDADDLSGVCRSPGQDEGGQEDDMGDQ